MDLKPLAWFFEDDVEEAQRAFLSRCRGPEAERWLEAGRINLMRTLFGITHRILVAHDKMVEGEVGFEDDCASLRSPEIRAYLHSRYPLLQSAMGHACSGWVEETVAVFTRYAQDREDISSALLSGAPPADSKHIRFDAGDHHRGGRSVAILESMAQLSIPDRGGQDLSHRPDEDDGELARIASRLLERCSAEGLRLNAPAPYPMGMLAGATGIAYQCLRLARLHDVPSMLCGTSRLAARGAPGMRHAAHSSDRADAAAGEPVR